MFSRGKATSGAPICSGMIQFAKPAKSGVANISSMTVPCIVNAWLNCSFDRIWVPGRASSARMTRARMPPIRKKANDVPRYSVPIVLWSVVVSHLMMVEPGFRVRCAPTVTAPAPPPAAAGSLRMVTSLHFPWS